MGSHLEPYHPAEIRLNTIGGNRFNRPGQWIAWEFEVPQDGLYRGHQEPPGVIGSSNRRVPIDGRTPLRSSFGQVPLFHRVPDDCPR